MLAAQRGLAFVVECGQAKAFALVHSLVGGADGGRVFVRCFDAAMNVRENLAGDALASVTTLLWNVPSKAWTGGAAMADASLNKRMTVRLGPGVAFAQIGVVGFDGQIDAAARSNSTIRVMARNISPATFDLGAATLSVQVTKRRLP